jgi:hypothetical protein
VRGVRRRHRQGEALVTFFEYLDQWWQQQSTMSQFAFVVWLAIIMALIVSVFAHVDDDFT